jgi:hypothetical protein
MLLWSEVLLSRSCSINIQNLRCDSDKVYPVPKFLKVAEFVLYRGKLIEFRQKMEYTPSDVDLVIFRGENTNHICKEKKEEEGLHVSHCS